MLLLASAVAIAEMAEVAVHELAHLVVDRLIGADASIDLHPFGPSATHIDGTLPDTGLAWAVAAGPAGAVVVCSVIALLAWRRRTPGMLALILLGPVALLFEGANAIVQLVEGAVGTDVTILVGRGVPSPLVAVLAGTALAVGLVWAAAATALVGFGATRADRWVTPVVGYAAYPLLGLVWVASLGPGAPDRNIGLLAFGLVVGATVAAIRRPVARRLRLRAWPADAGHASAMPFLAVGLAVVLWLV